MKRTIGIPPPTVFFVPIFKKKRGENYEIQNNYINWSCRKYSGSVFWEAGINSCRHCFCLWQSTGLQEESFFRQYLEKVRNLKMVHWKAELDGKVCAQKRHDIVVCSHCSSGCIDGDRISERCGMCIGFIANEGLSIIENAGLMGLPPESICQAIDVLKRHSQNTIEKQT